MHCNSLQPCTTLPASAILYTYINGPDIKKADFLPAVGYLANDHIIDTLFDSFLFLPSPRFLNAGGLRELKKNDWQAYIDNWQFAKGVNLDALEAAVDDVQAALGRRFKVNVFMTVFPPVSTVASFGEVNGKDMNFAVLDDRKTAIKWMVDEQIRQFNERNFKNLQLAGFYWHLESLTVLKTDPQMWDVIKYFTDYIRQRGYKTVWTPYHRAPGWDKGKELGFDLLTMQANYFPARPKAPNAGPVSRLAENAEKTKSLGYGVQMEIHGKVSEEAAITGFKQYMKYGVELGYMNNDYNSYYMNFGPETVRGLYDSTDFYTRETYCNLYAFIKRTLKIADIHTQ